MSIAAIGANLLSSLSAGLLGTRSSRTQENTPQSGADQVSVARPEMAKMFEAMQKLEDLQSSDPDKFKQITTDMASKLKAAAGKAPEGFEKEFLTKLAESFDASSKSGKLERPEGPGADGPKNGYGPHRSGGHHHGGHGGGGGAEVSQMSQTTQDLLAGLMDEISTA